LNLFSRDDPNEEHSARGLRPAPLSANDGSTAKGNAMVHSNGGNPNRNHSGSADDEGADDDGFVYQDTDADDADDAPIAPSGNLNRYVCVSQSTRIASGLSVLYYGRVFTILRNP
jgi:hypothetical protein